jgi:hypothetical protein
MNDVILRGARSALSLPQLLGAAVHAAAASDAAAGAEAAQRHLSVTGKAWTGDFDAMLERRLIRVALTYSRSL